MNTTFWGPSGWQFLHILTFIYPETPSFNDKVKMREFMNLLCFILPCKYCRLSFTKYIKSCSIDDYLDSRTTIVEWLYKIHNKINKKLRIQGFCKHSNPELSSVIKHYEADIEKIYKILNNTNTNTNTNTKQNEQTRAKETINYICNRGAQFLGSIVFNYQGYFTNCHTGNEKVRIVAVYHTFFNSIIPLICSYISKFCKDGKDCIARYKENMPKYNIRSILSQNEPYTKLVNWFYECDDLCTIKLIYGTEENYQNQFNKHIVMSCDNPKSNTKGKTCRAGFIKSRTQSTRKNLM